LIIEAVSGLTGT